MLGKIIIVDFEDSFTYNIANIIFPFEQDILVVSHEHFFSNLINRILLSKKRHSVILGPGPGHPDQYECYFVDIKKLLLAPNIYTMGICLGHQIMGQLSGYIIAQVPVPVHGQTVKSEINGKMILVQKYNSLGVFEGGKEYDICHYKRGISYQFHPESVGTKDNILFFNELLSFIK